MFNTDPNLQQTIDQWWLENFATPPQVTMHIDNIETCTKLVESGLGYAIIPSVSLTGKQDLAVIHLKDQNNEALYRDTWLFYHHADTQYPIIQKFILFLTEMFDETSF